MNAIQDTVSGKTWERPQQLIDHIVTFHHDYMRMMLPELERCADRMASDADWPAAIREELEAQLNELTELLQKHLTEQESFLFPLIRHFRDSDDETEWNYELDDSLQWIIERFVRENEGLLRQARRVRDSLDEVAGESPAPFLAELIDQVRMLSARLPKHIHLETQILFPFVRALIKEEGMADGGLW